MTFENASNDWSFLDARITETVATTQGKAGLNAAPMGIIREDGDGYARLWEGSDTLENVRSTRRVVVNFSSDPVVYVEGALSELGSEYFETHADTDPPRLSDEYADAWLRCSAECVGEERDGDVERWRLVPEEGETRRRRLFTVDRGFNSVIEATVHATRVEFEPELEELIRHHLGIARKCGGDRVREAADLIEEYVDVEADAE